MVWPLTVRVWLARPVAETVVVRAFDAPAEVLASTVAELIAVGVVLLLVNPANATVPLTPPTRRLEVAAVVPSAAPP